MKLKPIAIAVAVALGVVTLVPAGVEAQPSDAAVAEAERLFDQAVGATERGDFAAALRDFQASYAQNPIPDVLYNIGMCHKALGQLPEAANVFRDYVAIAGDQMSPEERAEFDALLLELVPQIGRISFEVNEPGATVVVDGVEVGAGALGAWFAVAPGSHTVVAEREGFSATTSIVEVPAGGTVVAQLVLAPLQDTSVPIEGEGISPTWFWVAVGTAGALAIGGAITGGLELAAEDDFNGAADRCNAGNDTACTEARSIYSDIETDANATTALLAIAGAAAVTALTLFFFTDFGGESPPPVAVGVAPTADRGAIVGATLWF